MLKRILSIELMACVLIFLKGVSTLLPLCSII
jgi:hypothetical protein